MGDRADQAPLEKDCRACPSPLKGERADAGNKCLTTGYDSSRIQTDEKWIRSPASPCLSNHVQVITVFIVPLSWFLLAYKQGFGL